MVRAAGRGGCRDAWRTILALVLLGWIAAAGVSADSYVGGIPLASVKEGTVSGGLYIDAYPGFATSAEQPFTLPKYTDIRWARLYVAVYCGHMENNYPVGATIDFNGGNGYSSLATEQLDVPYSFPGKGGTGPVAVNNHCSRVTSDYLMWYDVSGLISGQNVGARVRTHKPAGYSGTFDGRVKTITLVVAYDDGDSDKILYWVNEGHDVDSYLSDQAGDPYTGETDFPTGSIPADWDSATLNSVYLASTDGTYTFNRNDLDSRQPRGPYFGADTWDVSPDITEGRDSLFTYQRNPDETQSSGGYYKIFLAALSVKYAGGKASGGGSGGTGAGDPGSGVRITSSPDGAAIAIDNIDTDAATNTTLSDIGQGRHTFHVEKEGYLSPADQVVDVVSGRQTSVHFDLLPPGAAVTVRSVPSGASIVLDGNATGSVTPAAFTGLPPGLHTVGLSMDGYEPNTTAISLVSGQTVDLAVSLVQSGLSGPAPPAGTGSGGSVPMPDPDRPRYESGVSAVSGYAGKRLSAALTGKVNGNLSISVASDYTGLMEPGESRDFALAAGIPEGAAVEAARLYVYTTWSHDDALRLGKNSRLSIAVNGRPLTGGTIYSDRKGAGKYDYPAETYAYDVTPLPGESGPYTVSVTNNGTGSDVTALYGTALIVVYEKPGDPEVRYWVTEGSDSVFSNPDFNLTDRDAVTTASFDGSIDLPNTSSARLIAVSTAASGMGITESGMPGDANTVQFGGHDRLGLLAGGSSAISVAEMDVRPYLKGTGNRGGIGSVRGSGPVGDYLENRGLVLVLTSGTPPPGVPGGASSPADRAGPLMRFSVVIGDIIDHAVLWTQFLAGLRESVSGDPQGCSSQDCTSCPVPEETVEFETPHETVFSDMVPPVPAGIPSTPPAVTGAGETGRVAGQPPTGGVYVVSYPGESDIYVDGRKTLFATPFVIFGLTEGTHTVSIKKENSPVQSRQVYISGNHIVLLRFNAKTDVRKTIYVVVKGFTGDKATVNGIAPPADIPESVEMEAGEGFLTVLHNGTFLSFTVPGILQSGEVLTIRNDTPFRFPGVEIVTNPPGAEIIVDGFSTGVQAPAVFRNISTGIHRIGVSMNGFLPDEEVYSLGDGTPDIDRRIKFNLEPYGWGTLSVDSDPPGGKIALYGKDSGMKTPATIRYLSMGMYEVKVTGGNVTRMKDVMVLPGKEVHLGFDLEDED